MEVDVPRQPQQADNRPAPVLKKFPDSKGNQSKSTMVTFLIALIVVVAGVTTGWFLSGSGKNVASKGTNSTQKTESQKAQSSSDEEGQLDTEMEYQEAEGKMVEGGIKGEGTHHIERDNNTSRYVYLSSTAIDLDKYVGKKVKVWGETMSSKSAPWLMDVVKIKISE